jgi:hypothetical protein
MNAYSYIAEIYDVMKWIDLYCTALHCTALHCTLFNSVFMSLTSIKYIES